MNGRMYAARVDFGVTRAARLVHVFGTRVDRRCERVGVFESDRRCGLRLLQSRIGLSRTVKRATRR